MLRGGVMMVLLTMTTIGGTRPQDQLDHPRVREAYQQKRESIKGHFESLGLPYPNRHLFIRAFKAERVLEVWAAADKDSRYRKVFTYRVAAASGEPGPKRKEGDRQVPEGFYVISGFNPVSNYHLSMRVNYPNASDRILSDKQRPGSDIFIHGNQVSIGCLAMTDDVIKELYVMCMEGQKSIPVHIFPCRMSGESYARILKDQPRHQAFWAQLKKGYDAFERRRKVPRVSVASDGSYRVR